MIDPQATIELHQLGKWRYDGIQEGYKDHPPTWQFTRTEEPMHTVNIPCWLTGVPMVQRLRRRAEELLHICGTCGDNPADCFCRKKEADRMNERRA